VFAARDREANLPIEWREVARLEAPGLTLLEPQPRHADPLLDVVIEWDSIAVQVHRRR